MGPARYPDRWLHCEYAPPAGHRVLPLTVYKVPRTRPRRSHCPLCERMDCPLAVSAAGINYRIPTHIKGTGDGDEADCPTTPRVIRLPGEPRHGNHRTAADASKAMQADWTA